MSWKGKNVRIIVVDGAKEWLEQAQYNQAHSRLLRAFNRQIEFLKENPERGIHIQRNRIPAAYLAKSIISIWKLNLPQAWRCIYALDGADSEIIVVILDIYSHKEYEKVFGYG